MIKQVMPVFAFMRRHDIELETGLVLAGTLIVDIPKKTKLESHHQTMIALIIQHLTEWAKSGHMPHDGTAYAWPSGHRPPNADEITDNDALMASWAKERIIVAVRIDPLDDGMLRVDGDMKKAIGHRPYTLISSTYATPTPRGLRPTPRHPFR